MNGFLSWIDRKNFLSVRSFMLYTAVALTVWATTWGAHYAETTTLTAGLEIAGVIAAVTAPITALTGFIYNYYTASRQASK